MHPTGGPPPSPRLREAVAKVGGARIAGIAITHQRETFVCLDAAGEPIRPAITWMDVRATREVEEFGTADVHRITGKPPNPTPAWYKLLWLKKHEPETISAHRACGGCGGLPRAEAHGRMGHLLGLRRSPRPRRSAALRL